jgi:hypothetical protein
MTDSIYDQLNAYGTVAKQRFVETFSGDALDTDRWNSQNVTGSGSVGMIDEIDGGGFVSSASGANQHQEINFNGVKQFSPTTCSMIGVTNRYLDSTDQFVGFCSGINSLDPSNSLATYTMMNQNAKISIQTSDGSNTGLSTEVYASVNKDVNSFKSWKIEGGSSNYKLYISGVLEATTSTKIPTTRMQPIVGCRSRTATVSTTRVRYLEAYNT